MVTNGGEASHKNHKKHPNFPSVQFQALIARARKWPPDLLTLTRWQDLSKLVTTLLLPEAPIHHLSLTTPPQANILASFDPLNTCKVSIKVLKNLRSGLKYKYTGAVSLSTLESAVEALSKALGLRTLGDKLLADLAASWWFLLLGLCCCLLFVAAICYFDAIDGDILVTTCWQTLLPPDGFCCEVCCFC